MRERERARAVLHVSEQQLAEAPMKKIVFSTALALVALAPRARAQPPEERSWFQERMAAPSRALEITLGSGYTQGLGMLSGTTSLPSIASAGAGFDAGVGYRASKHLSLALVGQYHELVAERGSPFSKLPSVRGATAGVAVTYHFIPEQRLDPWVELGTGYRMLWETSTAGRPGAFSHGIELARARVGVDFRIAHQFALGPMIGADANLFLWRDALGARAIDDVRMSTFVFAGVQGRLDVGGTLVGATTLTSGEAPGSR
jgi:hypothetical protein